MLNGLDLFSGIGGISLALKEWVQPIAYCEIDSYCQSVLLSQMARGNLRKAPIWDDITTLDGSDFESEIDVIYGGFPCQDISVAGHGKGLDGKRSGLFFEITRLCCEIKPRFIFLENVPAITSRGGTEVVRQITSMGYDCRWCVISAASIGALHRRERWFLLAYTQHDGTPTCEDWGSFKKKHVSGLNEHKENGRQVERTSCISSNVADPTGKRLERWQESGKPQVSELGNQDPFSDIEYWREIVSSMGKSTNGIPFHVDRLRALGNSVVPKQAKEAFKILMGLK